MVMRNVKGEVAHEHLLSLDLELMSMILTTLLVPSKIF